MNPITSRRYQESAADTDLIRRFFGYDPVNGRVVWLADKGRARKGEEAGSVTSLGYRSLEIAGRKYQTHRVAWLLMTGSWPAFDIDHIDGNRLNNSFSNLREANRSENCQNRKVRSGSVSGAKGVYWHKKNHKWCASIRGKYLGSFKTIDEASEAYRRAAKELHGQFARQL